MRTQCAALCLMLTSSCGSSPDVMQEIPSSSVGGGGATANAEAGAAGSAGAGATLPSTAGMTSVEPMAGAGGSSGGASMAAAGADAGHDPFLGTLTEEQRRTAYFFQERDGRVVIEAEHFVMQRYGNENYQGQRWWMLTTLDFTPKQDPLFATRCQDGIDELMNLDSEVAGETIRSIITNHSDVLIWTDEEAAMTQKEGKTLTAGAETILAESGCDPDENHASDASGSAYVELLPDMLYDNNNAVPHAGCNWYNPEQAPKAFYRVNFSSAGTYDLRIRAFRSGTDSGSAHVGITGDPSEPANYVERVETGTNGSWVWIQQGSLSAQAGEQWIVLAGREDGFEVDKIVLSKGGCGDCNGLGPSESSTLQQ